MNQTDFFAVLKQLTGSANVVSMPKAFVQITKDLRAAYMLSELLYWSGITKNPQGMVYKTDKDFADRLGITTYGLKKAKKILIEKKFIETELHKANAVPTTHYRINEPELIEAINELTGWSTVEPTGWSTVEPTINKENKQREQTSLSTSVDKVASDIPKSFLQPDGLEKYKEGEALNKYWKSVGLKRGHTSLQSSFLISGKYGGSERKSLPVWAPITCAIRLVGIKPMKMAINNYKAYQDSADEYTKSANLSFAEFCHGGQYERYIDSVPLNEFQSTNPWDLIRKRFSPLTSVYVDIFDPKTQRYYGFQTNLINSEIRWEDIAKMIAYPDNKWDFNAFMELEWMIAGLLWRRKKSDRENDLEICQKYMDRWEALKDEFKKKARKWLKEDWELYG